LEKGGHWPGKILFDMIPNAQGAKTKIDKWYCIKLKSFSAAKEIINRLRRKPIKLEKVFANYTSDKWLISTIYKKLKKLPIAKSPMNPIKK
jgi:hypothetical protein